MEEDESSRSTPLSWAELFGKDASHAGDSDATSERMILGIHELPQEILDAIIDFLQEDRKALISCTLILRQWVYRARYHLFSTLYVKHPPRPSLKTLFIFIRDAPDSVNHNIRTLNLSCRNKAIALRDLAAALRSLPTLHLLRLEKIHWMRNLDGTLVGGTPSVCTFSTLCLNRAEYFGRDLKELLLLCPPGSHLFLEQSLWLKRQSPVPHVPDETVRALSEVQLHTLTMGTLEGNKFDIVLNALRPTHALATLTHLEFNFLYRRDVSDVNRFLVHVGPQLEHLALDLVSLDRLIDKTDVATLSAAVEFELAPCTALRSLRLDFDDPWDFGYLLAPVLTRAFHARAANAPPLALQLGIAAEYLEHVDIWDRTLGDRGRACIGQVQLWLRDEPRCHVYGNRGRWGRALQEDERSVVQERMPLVFTLGMLEA